MTQYFSCDPTAIGSLTAQMQKFYDSQQKSATWLAIINPARVESLHVGRKGKEPGEPYGEAFPLTNWNSAAIIDLLRTLPVEGAAETNRLWTRPDVEYRLGFTNALTYRVQVQGNQLRVWASDMPQVLQFTVPQKEVDELLTETDNRITYEKENIEKPNPETAKPVIYLYPSRKRRSTCSLPLTVPSSAPTQPCRRKAGQLPRSRTAPSPMRRAEATGTSSGRACGCRLEAGQRFSCQSGGRARIPRTKPHPAGIKRAGTDRFHHLLAAQVGEERGKLVTFAAEQYTDNAILTVTRSRTASCGCRC